ncbi:MAG TPA: hypothetical protein VM571_04945, partial [Noviherbaspirillum sp.]|nr:hypothetical protein [Noviherbaspirillum sp.]
YFSGLDGLALAEALRTWLQLLAENRVPLSAELRWLTWTESTTQLLGAVEQQQWYRTVSAPLAETDRT